MTEKSLVFLWSFLQAAESNLANSENLEPTDVVSTIVGARVSAFAEPDTTTGGKPTNNLSRWGKVAPELAVVAGTPVDKTEGMFA